MAIFLKPLRPYYGTDPSKRRTYERDCLQAEKISLYINQQIDELKDNQKTMLTYGQIATHTGIDERQVHKYCLQLDSATDNSIEISKQSEQSRS